LTLIKDIYLPVVAFSPSYQLAYMSSKLEFVSS